MAEFDKIDMKDTSEDVKEGVPCAACGKEMAQKKCKKRHGGCTEKRFCDSVCDRKKHEDNNEGEETDKQGPNFET